MFLLKKLKHLNIISKSNLNNQLSKFHSDKKINTLLCTDVYKMGHMEQYAPGTTKVYSYLQARTDKKFKETLFFGLQYYLKEYLSRPITHNDVDEFLETRKDILKIKETTKEIELKMRKLAEIGYWPIEIKAVPEGSIIPVRNLLMSITNTHPDFYWTVGFIESLLLKIWYPISVASTSYEYKKIINKFYKNTVEESVFSSDQFSVHDFGYRGDSSEEGAAISGVAHLLSFMGSDTVCSKKLAQDYYNSGKDSIMFSVPASEHSVMCSFGKENELDAYKQMLKLYPNGIVSIVSDTYDIFNVLTNIASILKNDILKRDGCVVFRPDSGNPEYIICGNPEVDPKSPEGKGCLRLLDEMFGSTINKKGFKVINPKVRLIYGDGMYLERFEKVLTNMDKMGYAADNLIIGVGGILRNHTRDTFGFAIKATMVNINGKDIPIFKDPITDKNKKSHTGYLYLGKNKNNVYETLDNVTKEKENTGILVPVFRNGQLLIDDKFLDIKKRVDSHKFQ